MYKGIMNERQMERAEVLYMIEVLVSLGLKTEAIEWYKYDHYDLLVKAGLCKWQPEPKDNPKAGELTEAFFAKYVG
jgi:hypothetical protein